LTKFINILPFTLALILLLVPTPSVYGIQSFQALLNRGNELYQQNQYAKAIILYKKSASRGGDLSAIAFNMGNCYFRLGDLPKAAAAYQKSLRLSNTDNPPALKNLASVLFRLKEYGQTIALYRRLLRDEPQFISGWLFLADAYTQTGDLISAQLALEKAHRLEPTDVSILYQLAEIHVALKEPTAAIDLIERAYVRKPTEVDFLFYMGDLYRFQQDYAQAATQYRKGLSLKPNDVNVLYKLADVLEKDNKAFLAMNFLTQALAVQPDFTDAAIFLGNLAFDLQMWDRSATAYLQALSKKNKEGIEGIRNIAFEYNKAGRIDEAYQLIKSALKYAPQDDDLKSDQILYFNREP